MSCLNLKRLLPVSSFAHRKVWKVLTNKLPLKLIRSMPTKKPKARPCKSPKKLGWPSLSIQPKRFKKKPDFHASIHHKHHHSRFQKRPLPVFVDQLFIDPVSLLPEEGASKEALCSSARPKLLQGRKPEARKEERRVNDDQSRVSADDMWESMVMASPQTHGIDERAEEFIARFRAEMRHQEMMARHL